MRTFARRIPATDPRVTCSALALLLVLPLLSFLPKFTLPVSVPSTSPAAPSPSVIPVIWLIGFLVFAFRSLLDLRALRRWDQRARIINDLPAFQETLAQLAISPRHIDLRLHPDLDSPVVSGLIRHRIDLPETALTWSAPTLKMALLHELAHIQRRDLWMASLAHLVCLIHWFNPAVWWLRRTLLTQCEFACDAHLLKKGADAKTYANALCDVAQSASAPALSLAMAGHAPLRERLAVLSSNKRHSSLLLPVFILLTAASAVAVSLAAPAAGENSPEPVPDSLETELRFTADPFPAD